MPKTLPPVPSPGLARVIACVVLSALPLPVPPARAEARATNRGAIPLAMAGEPGLALAGEPGAPRRPPQR
jgi:hypothetical protein